MRKHVGTVVILATLPPSVILLGFVISTVYDLTTSATHTTSEQLLHYVQAWLMATAFSLMVTVLFMDLLAKAFVVAFPTTLYTLGYRSHLAWICVIFFFSVLALANIVTRAGFLIEDTIGALYRATL